MLLATLALLPLAWAAFADEAASPEELEPELPPASIQPTRGLPRTGTTQEGFGACISEDLFKQWLAATAKQDKPELANLVRKGCIRLRGGLSASIIDRSWAGSVKARVFLEDESTVFWTYPEAIVR
jgi:hypothetical protein